MSKYKFVTNLNEDPHPKNSDIISFYQICTFPHPKNKMYNVRRFSINSNNEFAAIKNSFLSKSRLERFLKSKKNNQYAMYSTYDLNYVKYPTLSDILLLKSDILSNQYKHYGAAPF
jgi:hypothetical protein